MARPLSRPALAAVAIAILFVVAPSSAPAADDGDKARACMRECIQKHGRDDRVECHKKCGLDDKRAECRKFQKECDTRCRAAHEKCMAGCQGEPPRCRQECARAGHACERECLAAHPDCARSPVEERRRREGGDRRPRN